VTPSPSISTAAPVPALHSGQGAFIARRGKVLWPALTLAGILLFNLFFTKGFFSVSIQNGHLAGNLTSILSNGSVVMLLSMGMTLVIATAGIDLSVGSAMGVAGAVAAVVISRPDYAFLTHWIADSDAFLVRHFGIHVVGAVFHGHVDYLSSLWGIIGLALLAALLVGVINGLLVTLLDLQPIVATLTMMIIGQGFAELFINNIPTTFDTVAMTAPTPEDPARHVQVVPIFLQLGQGYLFGLPISFLIAMVMAIVTAALVRSTALGLFLESIGNNATASRYAGVNARAIKIVAYVWCSLCAGIAGIIWTANFANLNPAALFKENRELDGILAAAIGGASLAGGRFSLAGSLLGALVIQVLTTTLYSRGSSTNEAMIVKAGVVVGVCLLQSEQFRKLVGGFLRKFRSRKVVAA
jgi:galactofuranose transport system permease protein